MVSKSRYLRTLPTAVCVTLGAIALTPELSLASDPMFHCQSNEGTPTTVAKGDNGQEQSVFHWKLDPLYTSAEPQKLCDAVTEKLNDYISAGNDPSILTFKGSIVGNGSLPAVCIANEEEPCQLPLFTLRPAEDPLTVAEIALNTILDPQLQANVPKTKDRGIQRTSYQVNFWQLFGGF